MIMMDKTRGVRKVRSRADCPSIHHSSSAFVICPHLVLLFSKILLKNTYTYVTEIGEPLAIFLYAY